MGTVMIPSMMNSPDSRRSGDGAYARLCRLHLQPASPYFPLRPSYAAYGAQLVQIENLT